MNSRRPTAFLAVLVALAIAKAVLTRWLALDASNLLLAVALESALIVAVLCLADLLPRTRSIWLDLGAYTLLVAVMFSNMLYVTYFEQVIDPGTLGVADQAGAVSGVIADMLRPVHLLYAIDLPFLLFWAIGLGRSRPVARGLDLTSLDSRRPARSRVTIAIALAALVLTGVQLFSASRVPLTADSVAVARARGFGVYQVVSLIRTKTAPADKTRTLPVETSPDRNAGLAVQQRIDDILHTDKGRRIGGVTTGRYAGANVIVIQVEAYQALAFGATVNGQEITPNMNRMADDSWVCTNAFSQTSGGNTSDAEFTANSSLLPIHRQAAAVEYADRRIPALPRLLSSAGYRTFTLHANTASFWNRKELYAALGFDAYYDRAKLGDLDRMWKGSSDEAFFVAGEDVLKRELAGGKPVYATFVTMSSHAPFTSIPYERRPLQIPEEWRGQKVPEWVGSMSYTDKAVGQFLDELRASGVYNDSIVILYGDHAAATRLEVEGADKEILESILRRPYSAVDRQRIPLLIHLPGQRTPEAIASTVGQADIAPTIADLLGVDLSATPHLGRSVFVDSDPLVLARSFFPTGSFMNSEALFMPGMSFEDGTALRLSDGREMTPTEREKRDFERAAELSALSDEWARSLPVRPDAGTTGFSFIPKKSLRSE